MRPLVRAARLLPAVLLLAVLAVSASAPLVAAASPEAMQAATVQPQLSLSVEKAVFKLIVCPDGAVRPVYQLSASADIGDSKVSGEIVFESHSVAQQDYSSSSVVAKVALSGIEGENPSSGTGSLSVSYTFGNGRGQLGASGTVHIETSEKTYDIELKEFGLRLENNKVKIRVEAVLPAEELKESSSGGEIPTVDEINQQLAASGYGFIRVDSLGVSMLAGNRVQLQAEATVDLEAMLQAAMANGLSSADAKAVRELINAPYSVSGKMSLSFEYSYDPGKASLSARLEYSSESRGDLEKLSQYVAERSDAVNALVLALLQPLLAKNPEAAIAVSQLQRSTGMAGSVFITKPPSESKATVNIRIDNGKVLISVDYQGPRLYVPASTPTAAAEKALTAIATQYQQLLSTVGQLAALVPGVTQILPTKIQLEPGADCVKLSRTEATVTQLASVKVDLTACKTQQPTAAKPATTTATTAATTTRQETTTATPTPTGTAPAGAATGTATARQETQQATQPAAATTTTATETTQQAETPPTAQKGGTPGLTVAAAVAAVGALAVALLIFRR